MTGFTVTFLRYFDAKEGKPESWLLKTQLKTDTGIVTHEGFCPEPILKTIGVGDVIEYIAEKGRPYKDKPQVKFKDIKLLKKCDEVEYSFGQAPKLIPGQLPGDKIAEIMAQASINTAALNQINAIHTPTAPVNNAVLAPAHSLIYQPAVNESKEQTMARMAAERDAWMERLIAALEKNTAAQNRLASIIEQRSSY